MNPAVSVEFEIHFEVYINNAQNMDINSETEVGMGKETRLFKTEERKTRTDVSNFLHQLADKISNGTVVLSQGAEEITLQLPQNVILEIQAE